MEARFHAAVGSGVIEKDGRLEVAIVLSGDASLAGVTANGYNELVVMLDSSLTRWGPHVLVEASSFTPARTSGEMRTQPVRVVVAAGNDGVLTARGLILDDDTFVECFPYVR